MFARTPLLLAISSAFVFAACSGDDPETNNANNNNSSNNSNNNSSNNSNNNSTNNTTDTTPPTVTITDNVSDAVATGDVTFTFTFSESIVVEFGADDVTVTGGVPGAFTVVDDKVSRLVVSPMADSTGTIEVAVAPGAFEDLAGNVNTEGATATQDYDTTVVVMKQPMNLPVTFDDQNVEYGLTGFGGSEDSGVEVDPTDGTNMVARVGRSATAEVFAGVTLSVDGTAGFENAIPFDADNTRMTVRVWSPDAGIQVRVKVEDASDATVSVETEATTSVANDWETLTFEFVTPVAGTAALDFSATYDKATIFFNFGVDGATAGEKTYYFDDMIFIGGTTPVSGDFVSLTFDDAAVTYTLTGFGGAEDSTVVMDPTDSTNMVAQVNRSDTAELWAGTTVSTGPNESVAPFAIDAANTRITIRVWSPDANIQVRAKIEDAADPTVTVETEATTTMASAWETLTFDFANEAAGTAALDVTANYNKISVFFNFGTTGADAGAKTYYFDDIVWIGGTTPQPTDFTSLTFDDPAVTYAFADFGGAVGTVVVDPTDATNMVGQVVKSNVAEVWAGTTPSTGPNDSVDRFPMDAANTRITVRVWSPDASVPVRIKLEDASDPTVSVEAEVNTTMAGAWETLTYDFTNQVSGTAAVDFNATYDKMSVFFNFGTSGADAGEKTYYFDDVIWIGGTGGGTPGNFVDLTFDDPTVTYTFTDFGGSVGTVVVDPTLATNMVGQVVKSDTAELWAGTTVSTGPMDSVPQFPVDAANTRITVRVWSPDANVPVRIKIEDASDPTVSVETEVNTTMAGAWETLTFDFANEVTGTAALNPAATYDKMSVFFNFGTTGAMVGAAKTYYFDDVIWIGGTGGGTPGNFVDLTFDDAATTYTFANFGGATGTVVVDPTLATNMVGEVVKSNVAELWAGVTPSTLPMDAVPTFPIDANNTRITMRVWSPDANIPVRVKIEDATNPTISVETEVNTTVASAWETLTFDFANEVTGTAAVDVNATYNKVSIFFNFGTTGAMAGAKTYYFDDIVWIGGGGTGGGTPTNFVDLTFDDAAITYAFANFGGATGTVVVDPTNATNMVGQVDKSNVAELWAGVTPSTGPADSVPAFPFDASNTRITVRVWSPDANIPVRVKVEDSTNAAVSVEAEVMVTVASAWETLTVDFASQAMGTAALDLNATYDKVSIFFNFGTTGATAGMKTYYFDDIVWIGGGGTGGGTPGAFTTVTFDDAAITYGLAGFGGAEASAVVVDPTNATNMVAEVTKSATAELWAGTTFFTGANQSVGTIPIAAGMTQMNVRVWSPVSNIPIRLKIEDAGDPTRSVETEAMFTATASSWQTLSFNFANQAMGTAAVNFTYTYNKASIFFDFGTTGAMAGAARTYYFDDVAFGP